MYTPTFAELAGDEDHFFAHYFNKLPLVRRGALAGDPRQVLSLADLDQMVHLEIIRPPHFGATSNGEGILRGSYTGTVRVQGTDVTDTVVPARAYELFRTGATLTWTSLNHVCPNLRALAQMLSAKFAVESTVTAFLTPAGKQGFNPHHDPGDVFIVQLAGTKHWQLWTPPAVRRVGGSHYKLAELGAPAIEVSVRPGDVLYLPFGTPHVATAEDEVSLHLSVLIRPQTWKDLLCSTVDRLVEDNAFEHFPHLVDSTVAAQAEPFADRLRLLARRLEELDVHGELRRLMALGRRASGSAQGDVFQAWASISSVTPSAQALSTQ
jgi:ribosomal protein L16 Arg81 hydroxylase